MKAFVPKKIDVTSPIPMNFTFKIMDGLDPGLNSNGFLSHENV